MGEIIDSIIDNTCTELSVETSTIRANAFREKTSLTKFTDPNVINLGDYAFAGSGITKINFPDAENLGKYAFSRCDSLTEIYVGFPTALPEGFCYGTGNLVSFPMETVKTFGKNCLRIFRTGRTKPSNSALTDIALIVSENDNIVFEDGSLAGQISSANAEIGNIGRIIADNTYYIGFVENVPTSQTVMIYDELFYNDAKTPSTAKPHIAKNGDMVILESSGKPYVYRSGSWIDYIPTYSASYGDDVINNNRMRSLGFKVKSSTIDSFASSPNSAGSNNIRFIIVDKNYSGTSFSIRNARGLTYLRFEKQDGTLSNVYPFSTVGGGVIAYGGGYFANNSLADIDFSNVSIVNDYGFYSYHGNPVLTFPKLTNISGSNATSDGTTFASNTLEEFYAGDGTESTLTLRGCGIWRNNSIMYKLGLDYTSVVPFTGLDYNDHTGDNNYTNTLKNQLSGTPIYWYKGITSTAIAEDDNTNPITIYGQSYNAQTNDIVTYGNKQWQLKSNGKWTEWGENGNKRPRVVVPNDLIKSYLTDKFVDTVYPNYEKWGNLNPEVFFSQFGYLTPQVVNVSSTVTQNLAIMGNPSYILISLAIKSFTSNGTGTVSVVDNTTQEVLDTIALTGGTQNLASLVFPDESNVTYVFSCTDTYSIAWEQIWGEIV